MQIASEKKVYILDLIKLYGDVPGVLDECLGCLLHSSSILKLGKSTSYIFIQISSIEMLHIELDIILVNKLHWQRNNLQQ